MTQASQGRIARRQQYQPGRRAPDTREKIAFAVQSIILPPLGTCILRAALGVLALTALKIPAKLAVGGMIYRAGPDERRDVVAFCGPGNSAFLHGVTNIDDIMQAAGMPSLANGFLGHAWIKSGDRLVDFSAGEWHDVATAFQGMDDMGDVQWHAEPPSFYWQDWDSLTEPWQPHGSPDIGQAWYKKGIAADSTADAPRVQAQLDTMISATLDQIRNQGLFRVVANNLRQLMG